MHGLVFLSFGTWICFAGVWFDGCRYESLLAWLKTGSREDRGG